MIRYAFLLIIYVFVFTTVSVDAQNKQIRFSVVYKDGRPFHDLKPEQIRIRWNGESIQPASLETVDGSRALLILMDASLSQVRVLPEEKNAAEQVIRVVARRDRDHAGVAKFNARVESVHPISPDLDSVLAGIKKVRIDIPAGYLPGQVMVINGLPTSSGPPSAQLLAAAGAFFDAVGIAASELAKTDIPDKILVIVSDGNNTYGEMKLKEAIAIAAKARVRLFAIGIADPEYEDVDERTLRGLTDSTGGIAVRLSKRTKLADAISQIDNVVRSTYVATMPTSSSVSEISIEIVDRELKGRLKVISPEMAY